MNIVTHITKKALIHWFEANFDWESPDARKAWDDFYFVDYDALVNETVNIDSEFDRILGRKLYESFSISDDNTKEVKKNIYENLMVDTRCNRINTFIRHLEEEMYISDNVVKNIKKQFEVNFKIFDEWIRKANGVYSDLYLSQVPVNLSDFEAELNRGAPVGYSNFTTYIPGYYEFESAMFRMVLRSVGLDRIRLKKLKMVVDVPDVFDRGEGIAKAGADGVVEFSRKYIKPPKVIGMQSGGSEQASKVEIDNITKLGFSFRLLDNEGNKLAGTLSWISEGY